MEQYSPFEMRKFVAPEFIFGRGAMGIVGRYIKNLGVKKAMIVTDQGVIDAGWSGAVEKLVKESGIPFILYSGVTANPKDSEVMEGSEIYSREGCDVIVAVGGGSPIDCAKGIGIVSTNNQDILEFEGVDCVPLPGPPLICIPTTAGSSADVSQFAIIHDSPRKVKIAIVSKALVPDVALIDPVTTTTMSPELTAETGMDALCHAFEAYVSNASSPVTDVNALKAVSLVTGNLVKACTSPGDMRYRDGMMLASLLAGLAFSNASLGVVHAMAHALGGLLALPHGECNAILLEHAVRFNFSSAVKRYADLAVAMGVITGGMTDENIKDALVNELGNLRRKAGITATLASMGVGKNMLPQLAEFAYADPCMVTNPRDASIAEIEGIFAGAL
jgi:alcohol dehydrogenase class IV